MKRHLPDWIFPIGIFACAVLLAVALWAVGDGRGAGAFTGEVRAARYLLAQEATASTVETDSIFSALRTLDPVAVRHAEAGP